MVHAVLLALRCAAAAGCRAKCADGLPVFPAPGQRRSRQRTNVGAFEVQSDAARHWFWVSLLQASRRALQARCGTFMACAQACFFDWVEHGDSVKLPHGLCRSSIAALERCDCSRAYAVISHLQSASSVGATSPAISKRPAADGDIALIDCTQNCLQNCTQDRALDRARPRLKAPYRAR